MTDFVEAEYEYHLDYAYSYGGISPFFREVRDNAAFLASRCPSCSKTLIPPVADCTECRCKTDWVSVPHTGTVVNATYCYHLPAGHPLHRSVDIPFILGIVQIDETDSWLMTLIVDEPITLHGISRGDRVRAVFRNDREGKVSDFYFVRDEPADT
jgi:uncharacterized OB-fold protein